MRKQLGLVGLGVATICVMASVGCDVIWGVHAARRYVAEGGAGGVPTTASTGGNGGGSGGSATTSTGTGGTGTCSDGKQDGNESDIDCGGSCLPCGPGLNCNQDADCLNHLCSGGVCTGVCTPGMKQCSGDTPQTCDAAGQWQSSSACTDPTPVCAAGGCVELASPSCQAGATGAGLDCGPGSNESCCASPPVDGGGFYRSYDGVTPGYTSMAYLATVSGFKLDKYEVTVGRFRQFVGAWVSGWRPVDGAGTHGHLNGGKGLANSASPGTYETGWQTGWAGNLATAEGAWDTNLSCSSLYQTWTPSAASNENRPINCVTWHEAYAFCIWDGGFLPSEAEWNYAASAGSDQRGYPWGSTAPGANAALAAYGCNYGGSGTCAGVANIAPVGSVAAGNGKYGQADLAGNVWEWTLDWYANYVFPCNDCSYLVAVSDRTLRGGSFYDPISDLLASNRYSIGPTKRHETIGVRCARSP